MTSMPVSIRLDTAEERKGGIWSYDFLLRAGYPQLYTLRIVSVQLVQMEAGDGKGLRWCNYSCKAPSQAPKEK